MKFSQGPTFGDDPNACLENFPSNNLLWLSLGFSFGFGPV